MRDLVIARLKIMNKFFLTICFFMLFLIQLSFASEISVMTFNVENLFDTKKDPQKEDYTFLPLEKKSTPVIQDFCKKQKGHFKKECFNLDWNEKVLNQKMQNLSAVILSVNKGKGPDILMLVEVENENILTQLNKSYLMPADYKTQVLIEGTDNRGIDVALLSRLKIKNKPKLHLLSKKSRGLLEVTLTTPEGFPINVYVGHFPSQRNPRSWRKEYVEKTIQILKHNKNEMFVLGGDLNISSQEEKEVGFFKNDFSKVGLVSHLLGCQNCLGTHKYKGKWSFLDTLVFSKNLSLEGNSPYFLDPLSIEVVKKSIIHFKNKTPQRFDPLTGQGVSDHLPFMAVLKLRSEKQQTLPLDRR